MTATVSHIVNVNVTAVTDVQRKTKQRISLTRASMTQLIIENFNFYIKNKNKKTIRSIYMANENKECFIASSREINMNFM